MFSYLYHRVRYGSYLHNEHGIKKFAERSLGQLVHKVTKKSAFYREMNENLLVEKANLRLRADELYEQPMLKAGEYFSKRRNLWVGNVLLFTFIVASILISYLSITAIVEGAVSGFLLWLASALLAIVLTGGGIIVAERLIDALIPSRPEYDEGQDHRVVAPLWAFLLIGIELSLYGMSQIRAEMFEVNLESNLVQIGYVALAMMLPLIAGAFRWHTLTFIDKYKTTQALRQIEARLAQIDSILRQNEEYESNFYKVRSIASWDQLNEFKTYKETYNAKKGYEENVSNHFARSYDAYQAEANKRYESDIRDITAKSIRKLELVEKSGEVAPGSKLGQHPAALRPSEPGRDVGRETREIGPRPSEGNGKKAVDEDIYLSPQPIR